MRLQYRYFEHIGFQYIIQLYCEGWIVKAYKVYLDELDDEIDKLEKQGYKIGYTEEEVDNARQIYEEMLSNIIAKDMEHIKMKF